MINDIRLKLKSELENDEISEVRVVYILSRIRKILEIDGKGANYNILKFYCDWALHSRMDNTKPVNQMIKKMFEVADIDSVLDISNFRKFDLEFKEFLSAYDMQANFYKSSEKLSKFHNILRQIYEDTPLIVKDVKKFKLTLKIVGDRTVNFTKEPIND